MSKASDTIKIFEDERSARLALDSKVNEQKGRIYDGIDDHISTLTDLFKEVEQNIAKLYATDDESSAPVRAAMDMQQLCRSLLVTFKGHFNDLENSYKKKEKDGLRTLQKKK